MNVSEQLREEKYIQADVILIHVPKTSGTTLTHILHINNIKYVVLHVNFRWKCYPKVYLERILKDTNKKVIFTWRNPVEHVYSCFNFYSQYKELNVPDTLSNFINIPKFQNMQTGFINREYLFEKPIINNDDLDQVKLFFNRKNTMFFLTDYFSESVEKLKDFLHLENINVPEIKRFNYNKLPVDFLTSSTIQKITNNNKLDITIYKKVIQQYNYKNTLNLSDIIISDPPFYFPYIWICKNLKDINKYKQELLNIHTRIKLGRITIEEYFNIWIREFKNIDLCSAEVLYLPENYQDLISHKELFKHKIEKHDFFTVTFPDFKNYNRRQLK